jgi:hypothetical protein
MKLASELLPNSYPVSEIDPNSNEVLIDPWTTYAELQRLGSAVWLTKHQMFALTRYDSVVRALKDTSAFSSASGVMMNEDMNQVLRGIFPDDAIATAYFTATTDYTNGAGAFTLYPILTLDDGSVLWLKSVGTAIIDGTKTQFVGTVTVLGGTGRFDGIAGDGALTGTRYTPLSVGADLVSDYTVRIEKFVRP